MLDKLGLGDLFFCTKTVYAIAIIIFYNDKEEVNSNTAYRHFVLNLMYATIVAAIVIGASCAGTSFE